MATPTAYRTRTNPQFASDPSDETVRRIRAACVTRGPSLHRWVCDWATAHGRSPHATYRLALATLRRRVARGLPADGPIGKKIVSDLRSYLGSDTVPECREAAS